MHDFGLLETMTKPGAMGTKPWAFGTKPWAFGGQATPGLARSDFCLVPESLAPMQGLLPRWQGAGGSIKS